MKIIILLAILVILVLIARSYKTEKFKNIKVDTKELYNGDLKNHEAGILISLMAKVAKADGKVCELEAEILKHTFNDISSHFQNQAEIREKLKQLYNEEKESFDNTIELSKKFYKITKFDYQKRLKVLEYLLNLAFIDKEFNDAEAMITEDIASALEIKQQDYIQMVNKFKSFYENVNQNIKKSLENSYEILGASPNDDLDVIKKKYRELVKKHHPDIIAGQGASEDLIEQATRKLQEINEAYENIKNSRK